MTRISDPQVWRGERDYYITVDQARKKLGEELWSKFKPWGAHRGPCVPGRE